MPSQRRSLCTGHPSLQGFPLNPTQTSRRHGQKRTQTILTQRHALHRSHKLQHERFLHQRNTLPRILMQRLLKILQLFKTRTRTIPNVPSTHPRRERQPRPDHLQNCSHGETMVRFRLCSLPYPTSQATHH